jgi:hypothetical protein
MTTSSLSTKINYRNAQQFVDAVKNEQTNLYVFIGRPQAWPDDQNPPSVGDNLSDEYKVWHDMTAMKRVIGQDVTLGFRRINWVSGTVYDEYADDVDLVSLDFYVYTDEQKVYKCISNNNGGASTTKPTHTTADITKTVDGYKWKYMFTISDSLVRKFAVGNFLPISRNDTVVNQAVVGSIDELRIQTAGTGYEANASISSGTEIPIFVYGDGVENATATCTITTIGGVIQSASINDGGDDYPYAPESNVPVMIRQVSSSGAIETAYGIATTDPSGSVTDVSIVIGGTNYTNGAASIVQSSCWGYAETNSSGVITNVEIATGRAGSGFRVAKAIVVGTSITAATIRPIISPFRGHGASPERELFAKYVLLNLNFAYDEGEGDFTIQNDFRTIGLIENPLVYNTTTLATARTLNAKPTLKVSDISGTFSEDDIIYGQTSGAKGIHVDIKDGNLLRYIKDDNTLSNNIDFELESILSQSGASAVITEIINPEVQPYSGDILFINNKTPIDRTSDQIETITLVLEY